MSREILVLSALVLGAGLALAKPASPAFEFDHFWIVVSPGAPERSLLEREGLRFAPGVNRHDGQGTASISVEFLNSFLELLWPDSTVPVDPGREAAVRKFRQRMDWRRTGASPIGIQLRRAPGTPDSLPFPTWQLHMGWMPEGAVFEMMTPRTDSISPSFSVLPRGMEVTTVTDPPAPGTDSIRATALDQPPGSRTVTGVRLLSPKSARSTDVMRRFESLGAIPVVSDRSWAVEVTLDGGKQGVRRDLRPALPLVIRR